MNGFYKTVFGFFVVILLMVVALASFNAFAVGENEYGKAAQSLSSGDDFKTLKRTVKCYMIDGRAVTYRVVDVTAKGDSLFYVLSRGNSLVALVPVDSCIVFRLMDFWWCIMDRRRGGVVVCPRPFRVISVNSALCYFHLGCKTAHWFNSIFRKNSPGKGFHYLRTKRNKIKHLRSPTIPLGHFHSTTRIPRQINHLPRPTARV